MAGVRHDSLADIELIADNLSDRYKSGFPILKEIVQNADDAGATSLSFGYCAGLADAEHELLKGSAVFFINDGPLTEADADAILSIALGSKASNENAIGKFGLGMKSLFHLCEAFFYLSDQWEVGEEFHSNIFNPWSDLRSSWETFTQSDKQAIQQHLAPVIKQLNRESGTGKWFIVWVPLRKRHPHYGAIIEHYPGDDNTMPNLIADNAIEVKLGQLLPLLKGLKNIAIWQPEDSSVQSLHCTSTIQLSDGAIRRQFHAPVVNSALQGKVLLASDKEQHIDYAGYENLLPDDLFQTVRSSEFWPKSYERDRVTGKERKVEDKAKPHLAIVICQRKAVERASCYIDWAVFLPLGSYPQTERSNWVNVDDKYDTQVFIHGYFFIDAGRVHIHGLEDIGKASDAIENHDQVRRQWNSLLATEGCLSYLPEAVHNFVVAHQCNTERIQHLSEAIFKSDFVRRYREHISRRYQWLYQLKPDEKSWQLVSAEFPALPLPNYPKNEQGRAWSVFPKLAQLSNKGFVFYDQSQVALLNEKHGWNDELILQVLNIDIARVFCNRTLLAYFNEFLSLDEVRHTERIKTKLLSIARHGLALESDQWTKSRTEMKRFLGFIPLGQRTALSKLKLNGIWPRLAKLNTQQLIIPKEVASESEQNSPLSVDDAYLLLGALDGVLGNDALQPLFAEAQALVSEIMGLVAAADKAPLLKKCADFRLFKVHDLVRGKDAFFAKSDLVNFYYQKSLFRFVGGVDDVKFKFGRLLLKAVKNPDLYFLGKETRELVFDKHKNITECDEKACLNYIDFKKPELADVEYRSTLIEKIASFSDLSLADKKAFRYLLHGDLDHYDSNENLLAIATDLDSVWEKLGRSIYKAGHDDWRLVEQILIQNLSKRVCISLEVNELDKGNIIGALKQRFQQINFESLALDQDERNTILQAIDNEGLWKRLPLHEAVNGECVAISDNCFLDNEMDIPSELETQFIRIRKSNDPSIAKRQSDWIPKLDQQALVHIILSSPNPQQYYQLILERLESLPVEEKPELFKKLKSTAWVVNAKGQAIKPEDIINIEGLEEEVKRLTAESDAGYYAPDDLHTEIRCHPAYGKLKKLFACEQEGLDSLLLMLGESDSYAIGKLPLKLDNLISVARLVANDLNLPGWTLLANSKVQALLKQTDGTQNNSIEPLLKPLSVEAYQEILNILMQCHEQADRSDSKEAIIDLFNAYLSLFATAPDALTRLETMKLLNAKEQWVEAEKLCVGIKGVDDDYLLDREQAKCLHEMIHSGVQRDTQTETEWTDNDQLLLQSTPNILKTYFREWDGYIENELIGFFISLLGNQPEIVEVARNFLGKRTVEGVRNKIDWQVKQGEGGVKPLFEGMNQEEAINEMAFLIRVSNEDSTKVTSIFNQPITVKLHRKPDSIIVDQHFDGQYKVSFQLRKLNVNDWTTRDLSELLQNSAEFILKEVYEQKVNLEKIWNELGVSDQLDIEIAKGLILDELPANLRQLSLQGNNVHRLLQRYQNEKAHKKEFELSGKRIKAGDVDKKIVDILMEMQCALIKDPETQLDVLNAIKNKIGSHQYQSYSVPFEMFQNADDAVFEFAEMQAFPETQNILTESELDPQHTKFQVLSDQKKLIFIHWGRAINYFRGSEGFPGKDRGFHSDLGKMLLMNTSDKLAENQVTGKFGLGFKSVYLISDKPKILSGRLGVEIFAAMLPKPLQEADRRRLREMIEQVTSSQVTATAIELPLVEAIQQETVLQKFKAYAGVLTAFSKCIKQISFNQDKSVIWHDQSIFEDLPELRKGQLSLWEQPVDAIKFVFMDENRQYDLLFFFGATGFKNFPEEVEQECLPRIWILAPTVDKSSIGFLINAGFDVDTGRMQLAHESENNNHIMLHLGTHLTRIVAQLNDKVVDDWVTVQQKLNLATDVNPYQFWQSFWQVLVSSWVNKEDNKVHQLVRRMLTQSKRSFIRLVSEQRLIPNGLWGDFQQLVSIQSIEYVLKGILSQQPFFEQGLDLFSQFVTAEALLHEKIQKELSKLLPDTDKKGLGWLTFDLVSLAEKTFADKRVNVLAASDWGRLLSQDLLTALDKTEESKKERQRLEKVLSAFEFLNQDGQFKSVSELLDCRYGDEEEKLKAAFAPATKLLNGKYDKNASRFFHFARNQLRISTETMTQWALKAKDKNQQIGVLKYLLKGEHSDNFAVLLRNKVQGSWLKDLNEQSPYFKDWSQSDITTVLKRKLATDEEMKRLDLNTEVDDHEKLDPKIVLNNVYNWWIENKEAYLGEYNQNVYPDGVFPKLLDDNETIDRDGWMTLLFLGALQTVGRTRDVQHKGAIRHFKNKGWWDVFIQDNPQDAPEQWMQVLDEYLQEQFYRTQYESWMMRFVTLYRFAHWLDEYANSWLAIRQQSDRFSLENVLNTATSQIHAGGGVNAPGIARTLGIGANFILRELVRHGVLKGAAAIVSSEHCFVATKRIRELFSQLGMDINEDRADSNLSREIHQFISTYLGNEKATFDWSFDIPFQIIAKDDQLQKQLLSHIPIESNLVSKGALMNAPSWAWDLLNNISFYVALVKDHHLPEPIVGYELNDSDDTVLLELELAWEEYKVGVIIDGIEFWGEIQIAQKLGWQIFAVDELEDGSGLEHFLGCFNQ